MAYTVASGAILEVSIRGTVLGQRVLSLFHYRYESTSPPANGVDTINAANLLMNTPGVESLLGAWAHAVGAHTTIEEMTYQWVHPTRRARLVKSPARPVGVPEGDPAPSNISFNIEKLTDNPGRRGHGQIHLPGLLIGDYNGNLLTLNLLNRIVDFRARLKETVPLEFGIQLTPVVFNREEPQNSVDIVETVVKPGVRTMHRRTLGVGE